MYAVYDLIIIGAGPGGIALAAEACASGINQSQILVLEKGATHNSAIRQLYPDQKLTTANYKGFDARCEGLLCVSDMTKSETIEFFDKVIRDYRTNIQFNAEVFGMRGVNQEGGARFQVESSNGIYESRVLAVGIGIFGRPNKPKEYRLLPSLKERLLFDMNVTSDSKRGCACRWWRRYGSGVRPVPTRATQPRYSFIPSGAVFPVK